MRDVKKVRHVFTVDSDEFIEPSLLEAALKVAKNDLADICRVRMDTYWKSPRYVIRPREELAPIIMVDTHKCEHVHIREYSGERTLLLGPEYGVLHHLSYSGSDARIKEKIVGSSHRDEILKSWYPKVWLGWNQDPFMRDLHPTHPHCYGFAERIELPEILKGAFDNLPVNQDPEVPANWPTLSVVIPLHGGSEDIRKCLASLEKCQDLCHEVIVVDDVSPDEAASVVQDFKFAKLIKNEENLGFAGTCNRGYEASTGEVLLFLNSDTVVPRSGLIRLIESLMSSGSIGAAGPMSNNAAYHHLTDVTYTDLSRMELFAQDYAHRDEEDEDVPILVGFCLAVKRSALKELSPSEGAIPFDTAFGRGLFEDNDVSFRLARAGWRLRLAKRAFVHHTGSQSLGRMSEHPAALLKRNMDLFHAKWRAEIESGYASHLPGQSASPIVFRPELRPERQTAKLRLLAQQADISLCMIVKNEERVLGSCLASAKDAFTEVIVVDTGSTDRTIEIAKEHGADVYEHPWENSFSVVRNHSLSYARGAWLMWLDADDTISRDTAFRILQAVMSAPDDVMGFIVPVQFVDEGPGAGTRVDHVKIFRNLPGIHFEGRIHEQILASLREAMPHGRLARIDGAVVLHSGYDNSAEGQKRKAERDEVLLALDFEERPNHPFVHFNLGMTAFYRGTYADAARWLISCLELSKPEESHVRKAYALLGLAYRELGNPAKALQTFKRGLKVAGHDPELHFNCGLVAAQIGELVEARKHYELAGKPIGDYFTSMDIGILGHKRLFNLAQVCLQQGNFREAKENWLQAIEANPGFIESYLALFDAAIKCGDLETTQEVRTRILALEGPSATWISMGVQITEKLGAPWTVENFLKSSVDQHPGQNAPLLAYGRWLLEQNRTHEARPILLHLERTGSAEAAYLLGVSDIRSANYQGALSHMLIARDLNPGHVQTLEQIEALTSAVGATA